jgi:proline iminopeptidase
MMQQQPPPINIDAGVAHPHTDQAGKFRFMNVNMAPTANSLAPGVHTFTTSTGATLSYHITASSSQSAPLAVIQAVGWGIGRTLYVNGIAPLLPNYTVLTLSARGSDESSRPEDVSKMSSMDMAEDLESLRQHFDISAFPVLLAHSNGGTIALAYAELYPTRVEKLVLICHQLLGTDAGPSGPTWDKFKGQRENLSQFKAAYERWAGPLPTTDEEFAGYLDGVLPSYMCEPERNYPEVKKQIEGPELPRIWCLGMHGMADSKQGDRQINLLDKVQARTLVITAREDNICGWDTNGKRTADAINEGENGKAELVVLSECGHFPWVERKEQFVDAVVQFLGTSK